jgi:hypothetical protein
MTNRRRAIVSILIAAAVAGCVWLWRLPSEETCARSGRMVDPTNRHCVALDGTYVQLRSHATMHATEVGWLLLLIGSTVFLIRLVVRRAR